MQREIVILLLVAQGTKCVTGTWIRARNGLKMSDYATKRVGKKISRIQKPIAKNSKNKFSNPLEKTLRSSQLLRKHKINFPICVFGLEQNRSKQKNTACNRV